MRILIAVHGRFFAFDLARALLARGHDVTVLTNYPRWAAARFGLPAACVRSVVSHGVLARAAWRIRDRVPNAYPEAWLHRLFGDRVAALASREHWDVLLAWSGVAEEALGALGGARTLRLVLRGSTHVRTQSRILEEEMRRTGVALDRPSAWMIAREEREYAAADGIIVLSRFCRDSFRVHGYPSGRVQVLPLGVRTDVFRPSAETIQRRRARILAGEPIRVLNVGAFSLRKGMWDVPAIVQALDGRRLQFRFVGTVTPEARDVARALRGAATFLPPVPEQQLPLVYAEGDVFLLPTLEEGFPAVLAQAGAAGLPILTTPNGAGADAVRDGETGWVLPPRRPDAFAARLAWCDGHRPALADMVERLPASFTPHDWSGVARDFEDACATLDAARSGAALAVEV